jgi:cytochrome c
MWSRRTARAALVLGFVLAGGGTAGAEQDRATPQEVIKRVQQAAAELAKSGEAGLATYSSRNPTSVWKDSYIFVLSCKSGSVLAVANPVRPELAGKPAAQIVTFGPKSSEQIAANFCAAGRQPHGGWVEYNFAKPGQKQPTRKVSYLLAA